MDTTNLSTGNTCGLPVQRSEPARKRNLWNMPLGSLINIALNNREAMGRFLSLTGGSVLYCLSALSIVYGITQMIGPPLAKSGALGDILPCVAVLNVYELALLAVLVLIVVWRNVTDDAISLVILVALFLVASGMTLGVVAPSGLDICLVIGFASQPPTFSLEPSRQSCASSIICPSRSIGRISRHSWPLACCLPHCLLARGTSPRPWSYGCRSFPGPICSPRECPRGASSH
jgi:hypothetical protein